MARAQRRTPISGRAGARAPAAAPPLRVKPPPSSRARATRRTPELNPGTRACADRAADGDASRRRRRCCRRPRRALARAPTLIIHIIHIIPIILTIHITLIILIIPLILLILIIHIISSSPGL